MLQHLSTYQELTNTSEISNTLFSYLKPRLHERFFARAGDAIFSNFVASPARDENRTCSHPRTGDATGEKIARKKSPELKFSQLFALVMRLKSI